MTSPSRKPTCLKVSPDTSLLQPENQTGISSESPSTNANQLKQSNALQSSPNTASRVHVNDSRRDRSEQFTQLKQDVEAFGFHGIGNLRDISITDRSRLKSGVLFRSATPSQATSSDFIKLVLGIDLNTIIDLREKSEDMKDDGSRSLLRVFSHVSSRRVEELDYVRANDANTIAEKIFNDTAKSPNYIEERYSTMEASDFYQQEGKASSIREGSQILLGEMVPRSSSEDVLRRHEPDVSRDCLSNVNKQDIALQDICPVSLEVADAALQLEFGTGHTSRDVDDRMTNLDKQIDEFIQSSDDIPRIKYYLPLAERKTMALALMSAVSMRDKLKVTGKYLVGKTIDRSQMEQAKLYMLKKLDELGLLGLNKIILRYSQQVCYQYTLFCSFGCYFMFLFF